MYVFTWLFACGHLIKQSCLVNHRMKHLSSPQPAMTTWILDWPARGPSTVTKEQLMAVNWSRWGHSSLFIHGSSKQLRKHLVAMWWHLIRCFHPLILISQQVHCCSSYSLGPASNSRGRICLSHLDSQSAFVGWFSFTTNSEDVWVRFQVATLALQESKWFPSCHLLL